MSNLQANVPLANIPFVGANGCVSEPWFYFLVQLFRRTGGTIPIVPITIGDVLGLEETFGHPGVQDTFTDITAPITAPGKLSEMILAPQTSTSYAQAAVSVTLGASPATYTATYPQGFYLSGGTVTALSLTRGATTLPIGNSASDIVDSQPAFVAGTSTSVTLPNSFGAVARLWVYFDGTFQGDDQIASLVGTTLTFTSAIPVGVSKVYVKGLLQSSIGIGSTLVELSPGDKINVTYSSLPAVTILSR